MPVYQYACTDCGDQLEVRQNFTDDALTICPACEGRLRKVLSAVGVVFKGSGFYRTDSRAAGSKGAGTSPGGADTGSSATSDAPKNGSSSSTSTTDSAGSGSGKTAAPTPAAAAT